MTHAVPHLLYVFTQILQTSEHTVLNLHVLQPSNHTRGEHGLCIDHSFKSTICFSYLCCSICEKHCFISFFEKLSDFAVPLLWNRKVKCVPCLWCNYSQYYEETWSVSFVRNRDRNVAVALLVCPGLLKQQDRVLLLLYRTLYKTVSQCSTYKTGSYETKYTRKWLRDHCPKIVKDPTIISGHLGCWGSPHPGSQTHRSAL